MAEAELPFLRDDQGVKDLETLLADADQTAAKVRAATAPPRRQSRGAARGASFSRQVAATPVHCQLLIRRAKNIQRTDSGGPHGAGGGADVQEDGRGGALHGGPGEDGDRHRLIGYLAQRVPSLFLASSFRMCLKCEVLKGMFL